MAKVLLFEAMRGPTQVGSIVIRMSNKKASQLMDTYRDGEHWGGNGVIINATEVTKQRGWEISKETRHFPMNAQLHAHISKFLMGDFL